MSYLIVDQAEEDCEISPDPFLEAGVSIPPTLPYQDNGDVSEMTRKFSTQKDEPE